LYTATVFPSRLARLRARFDPITASPITPMFAVADPFSDMVLLDASDVDRCVFTLLQVKASVVHPKTERD
jgi:hypothetical protein